MNKATIFLGFCLLLTACQSTPERSEESPFYPVPVGSTLVLHQALTIPPDSLKVYLQAGRVSYGPNEYYPFCRFDLREIAESIRTVEPDEFVIHRVRRASGLMAGLTADKLFASTADFDVPDGKPSPILYSTQMFLQSPRQPEVYKLTCGHLQDPDLMARHLSIAQMREALGEIFTLRLADQ